jgi:thymidine phosphorylase
VWGGSVNIAPADDVLIHVEEPLLFESFDKILVSIMAKKIAFGANHVIIDLPWGKMVKVHRLSDAMILKKKFENLAKEFQIKIDVCIHRTDEPAGRGIGPVLETREAIRVLQQKKDRPLDLEVRSINLAGTLIQLCLKSASEELQTHVKKTHGNAFGWATEILQSGKAFEKMKEIIKAQGGDSNIDSEDLKPATSSHFVKAKKHGKIDGINSHNVTVIAKILGAPKNKAAGIWLNKKINETVKTGETIYTLYSDTMYNIKEATESLEQFPILDY